MHSSTDIPEEEPTQFFAGFTVKWTRDLSAHYDPVTWTLTYYIRGPKNETIAASASGSQFAVTIAATTTETWPDGRYKLYGQVSKAGEIFEVYRGDLLIEVPPVNITEGQDMRSIARICRDNLLLAVQGDTSGFILNYSVSGAGRTIGKMTAVERIQWLDYWKAAVLREEQQAKIAAGQGNPRNIYVRFNAA